MTIDYSSPKLTDQERLVLLGRQIERLFAQFHEAVLVSRRLEQALRDGASALAELHSLARSMGLEGIERPPNLDRTPPGS